MRNPRLFLVAACMALLACASVSAQTYNVRMTADNNFAGYSGSPSAALAQHFSGAWPSVTTTSFTTNNLWLYVVAWDDGASLQGLLGDISRGSGMITTGSPLWQVCATGQSISSAPSLSALSTQIGICNSNNRWHATSVGPNTGNTPGQQVPSGISLWGTVPGVDVTAAWIWDTNRSSNCLGTNGFLQGPCNPGEYLIFRLPLERVAGCNAPVPDFTIDWTAGYGALVADGTNSQNELNHFWSVQLSNSTWGRFGTEVMQWFSGQAGVFDLRTFFENGSGTKMKCDEYYRVKLAVANNCISWRDVSKLVKIKCCPGEVSP